MFRILIADAAFVAATAMLIVVLGTRNMDRYVFSLVASLLYLLNLPSQTSGWQVWSMRGKVFSYSPFSGACQSSSCGCCLSLRRWEH
jgi:hypothetical protein